MIQLPWLDENTPADAFPAPEHALPEPNGLLALGGDLSPPRLLAAYRNGIFPWYAQGQPILWWSPDPRGVFLPGEVHLSRSLRRRLRRGDHHVTLDRAFEDVITGCAAPRPGQDGTWITREMVRAYVDLHELGHAHSLEVWQGERLAGGIYGVSLGAAFFGESMFTRSTDASKIALATLTAQLWQWGFHFLDCQMVNPHLEALGARALPRGDYLRRLERATATPLSVLDGQTGALDASLDVMGIHDACATDRRLSRC